MASGRMIQRRISNNKDLPRLITLVDQRLGEPHGAYASMLYTWCIAHLDVEGRMHGDPAVVKGTVVPRISGITPESVSAYLIAMAEVGLVSYYEAEDDLWLEFPGFDAAQPGLRKDREAASIIPAPSNGTPVSGAAPDLLRSSAGVSPAEVKSEVQSESEDLSPSRAPAHANQPMGEQKSVDPQHVTAGALSRAWSDLGLPGLPKMTDLAEDLNALPAEQKPPNDVAKAACKAFLALTESKRLDGVNAPKTVENMRKNLSYVVEIMTGKFNPTARKPTARGRPEPPAPTPTGRNIIDDAAAAKWRGSGPIPDEARNALEKLKRGAS